MSFRGLLVLGFGFLPASLAWGQFFTPVSTMMDAQTWADDGYPGTYASAPAQGPDDPLSLGAVAGSNSVSSQFNYTGLNYSTSSASTTVNLTPSTFDNIPGAGMIEVDQSATTNSGQPDYNMGYTNATIVFDLPAGESMYINMTPGAEDQFGAGWSLTGPNGTTYTDGNHASVPGGQYTLTSFAETEYLTGVSFNSTMSGQIRFLPEPSALAIPAALLILRRRRRAQ